MHLNRPLFVRVDGGQKNGLGHLVRCHALASMLRGYFDVKFYCIEIPRVLVDEFRRDGFEVNVIGMEAEFINVIRQKDFVVLDGYSFPVSYHLKIKNAGATLICVDDLADQTIFADLIINHSPGVAECNYRAASFAKFALGPEFVLLRPYFLEAARQPRIIGKAESVAICFGGADPRNLTAQTLKVVLKKKEFTKINIVVGASYAFRYSLTEWKDSRIEILDSVDGRTMADVLQRSDVAIVPSSGTLLEALASGCQVISGQYVDNQRLLFSRYKQAGAFVSAEDFSSVNLESAIRLVLDGCAVSSSPFDGQSDVRIREKFFAL